MKTLQNVLQKYEQDKQKVISSLELNKRAVAHKLLEEYKGLTYTTILDNTTKAQVSFSKNAENLLEIEEKELKELQNLKTIKNILLQQDNILEDKTIILEETMVQKQQHLLNLKNLEEKTIEKKSKLDKLHSDIRKDLQENSEALDKTITHWKTEREERLNKEEESILYEHNQKSKESKDKHLENLDVTTKELEIKELHKQKDIDAQRKELDENLKVYDESKEYIENFETLVSEKVATQSGMKLGFLKRDHENNIQIETNAFINKLDVLELDLENIIQGCQTKKSMIEELQAKLTNAKADLNNLTQNTLTI